MTEVSVVTTVKNEAETLGAFVGSLLTQSRPADQIVVVDGGSTDGTLDLLATFQREEPRLEVLRAPASSIAAGRNAAIAAAHGPLVAVADAGTVPDPNWLERLVQPLELDAALAVSSGYFRPGGATWFERCLTAVIAPHVDEVDPDTFLPSSRSIAFRREWWERVGGYPEWLRHCEDLVFDLALKEAGASFAFTPDAVVEWRARRTLGRFFRQYFDYARGDGRANLWPRRHLARYSAYAVGALILMASRQAPLAALALGAGAAVHLGPYGIRLWRHRPFPGLREMIAASCLVPVVVVTGDLAKMAGYPVGRVERMRSSFPAVAPLA